MNEAQSNIELNEYYDKLNPIPSINSKALSEINGYLSANLS